MLNGRVEYQWRVGRDGRMTMAVTADSMGWVGFGVAASTRGACVVGGVGVCRFVVCDSCLICCLSRLSGVLTCLAGRLQAS